MGKNKQLLIIIAVIVIISAIAGLIIIPNAIRENRYKQAVTYAEHGLFDEAVDLFSRLDGFKDSSRYLDYCLLRKAAAKGDHKSGEQIAAGIPDFKDTAAYRAFFECCDLAENGEYETAIEKAGSIQLPEVKKQLEVWQKEYAEEQIKKIEAAISEENWEAGKDLAEHALQYTEAPRLEELRDECALRIRERDYYRSIALIREENFDEALSLLKTLDGYEDSSDLIAHISEGEQGKAYVYAMFSEETDPHILASLYSEAGDYQDASERAENYQEQALEQDYTLAQSYLADSEWQKAKDIFLSLKDYKDSPVLGLLCDDGLRNEAYTEALRLMESGDFEGAGEAFRSLGDYKDSMVQAISCQNSVKE